MYLQKYIFILISGLFVILNGIQAQSSLPNNPNSTPYEVVYNHLFYLQKEQYDPLQSSKSFPDNIKDAQSIAIKLKQVLDGKGIYLDINRIPKKANYIDSLRNDSIYVLDKSLENIYLEKLNGQWTYSRTSVQLIPEIHKRVYPFGTAYITKFSAPTWQVKLFTIQLWKWLGLIILIGLSFLLSWIVKGISEFFITRFVKKRVEITDEVKKSLFRLSRVIGFIVSIRFVLFVMPMFQIAPKLNAGIIKSLNILSLFFVIIALKFVLKIVFVYIKRLTDKTENTLDDQLFPVLYKLSLLLLWTIGLVYIFDYLGVNITALLAGLSIGGLALALAAQDTVKNFFGSIMIFLDKPFQIGDLVEFAGVTGTIEEVGIRSTRIRTLINSLTYVPNAKIADSIINNLGLRVFRRFNTQLGITYDSPPEHIEEFVKGVRQVILMHTLTKKDNFEVHLNSFDSSSLNILVNLFFETTIYSEELKARHEIIIAIIKLAEAMNIRFAFPTQTLHIEALPNMGADTTPKPLYNEELEKGKQSSLQEIEKYFKHRQEDNNLDKKNT